MQSKRYSFVLSFLTMLAILLSSTVYAQLANVGPVTVTSDKDDYAPRSNAVFSGSGFSPNETVVLKVKNLSRPCNTISADSSYLPWSVTTDASGNFVTDWLVCDCPGDSLRLKAQGQTSGYVGYAYFTDTDQPIPSAPDLSTASDKGVSESDNITNLQQAVFNGTVNLTSLNPNAPQYNSLTVELYEGLVLIGSQNISLEAGKLIYDYSIPVTLSLGTHQIYAKAAHTHTNNTNKHTSDVSGSLSVTIDVSQPTVTINQSSAQSDPTASTPINFTVVFSEAVNGFTKDDIVISGTAGATTVEVTGSGPTYNVAVSGMTANGTVIATINANAVQDVAGNNNTASTSTDNTVTYTGACTTPAITAQPVSTVSDFAYGGNATFSVTASGTSPTYQWQELSTAANATWSNIAGATSVSYTITKPGVTMNGYQYRVVVSGCNTSLPASDVATLNIIAKSLSVTGASANSKTYDGGTTATFNTANAQLTGIVGSDDVSLNSSNATGIFVNKNVGDDIPVTAGGFSLIGTAAGNYTLNQPIGLSASITPATLMYVATAATKTYGDANPALTGNVTGFVDGEDEASVTTGTLVFTSPATTSTEVGTTAINGGGLTANHGNYVFEQHADNATALIITQRPLDFTASRPYNGSNEFMAAQLFAGNIVNNDAVDVTGSATVSSKDVNTYTSFTSNSLVSSNNNYKVTAGEISVSITQKAASVTPDGNSKTYGDSDPTLTGTLIGFLEADGISATYSRATGETVSGGPYTISATLSPGAALGNYDITYNTASFVIDPRAITITANAQTKIYGDSDPDLSYAITAGSLVGSDVFAGSLVRAPGTNVGTYAINQGTVALNANYTLTYIGADLTITPRPITVTPDASQYKIYGGADPAFAYTPSESLLEGNVFTGALARAGGEDAGLYAYTIGSLAAGDNYTVTLASAFNKFEIRKRAITVTANAGQTKVYGEADPTPFSYQITSGSLVEASHLSGLLSRVSGENVGDYAVQQGSLAATTNYELTFVPANFSITKRAITVTADPKSKYCGQADPGLTYQVTVGSLVAGDAFSGALSRVSGEAAGNSYSITQNTLTLGNNYEITYQGAHLSIIGVSIDAAASSNPVPSGSAATLSASVTPKVAGINVTFTLNGSSTYNALTDATGKATVSVSGLAIDLYQVEATTGAGCGTSTAYLPVYDQNGGFVTGGGWIQSLKGAYVKEPDAEGKANFGFVAKYKKGSTSLEGETEFQFQAGNLKFKSSNYEAATLVISGAKASYRGVGTINGAGSYKFTLVATDGHVTGGGGVDKVRMKIIDNDGNVVYDNQINTADNAELGTSTALGGGSIVIHQAKSNKPTTQTARTQDEILATAPGVAFGMQAYPNPTTHQFNIKLESGNTTDPITLRVTDFAGRVVRVIPSLQAGQTLQVGAEFRPGVYIVEMIQGNNRKQLRLLKQPN